MDFIPKKIRPLVESEGKIEKSAWECALLTAVRDDIKTGNISIINSKRFGRLDDFFISSQSWEKSRELFFKKSGLPADPADVRSYLTERLNKAYDSFLEKLPNNTYANVSEDGWHLSTDSIENN